MLSGCIDGGLLLNRTAASVTQARRKFCSERFHWHYSNILLFLSPRL